MESAMKSQPRVCFEFQVEKIVNMSTDGNFQVQWKPAWVSKFHLVGCEHLIQEFLQEQQGETDIKPYIEETTVYDNLCESQFNQEQFEANGETSSQPLLSCKMDAAEETPTNVDASSLYDYIEPSSVPSNVINAANTDETASVMEKSPLQGEYENYHHNKHHHLSTPQDHNEWITRDPHGSKILSGVLAPFPSTGDQEEAVNASVEPFEVTDNCIKSYTAVEEHVATVKDIHGTRADISPTSTEAVESHNLPQLTNILQDSHNQAKPSSKNTSAEAVESNNLHRIHIGVKSYSCDQCSYSCQQKGTLAAHLRTHTGEKPFSCGVCGNSFAQKITLLRHQRTHTGDKPLSCPHCKYCCYRKDDLGRHMRTHTSEKPFSCNGCQKSFKSKKGLKSHICNCAKCNSN